MVVLILILITKENKTLKHLIYIIKVSLEYTKKYIILWIINI